MWAIVFAVVVTLEDFFGVEGRFHIDGEDAVHTCTDLRIVNLSTTNRRIVVSFYEFPITNYVKMVGGPRGTNFAIRVFFRSVGP